MSYPHTDTRKDNISQTMRRGNFQQLEPMIGVGFIRNKKKELLQLFEPDNESKKFVDDLNGIGDRNDFEDKWYRHLCYCFECLYAIMIDSNANISSNPGFEWQLKYFGRD